MFWLVQQVPEVHVHGRKWKTYPHTRFGYWEADKTNQRYSHNPKRGIGAYLWIENDTADGAYRHVISVIKAPGGQRRWRRPHVCEEYPKRVIDRPAVRTVFSGAATPPTYSTLPTYVHFLDGSFIPIHGLRRVVVQSLILAIQELPTPE